MASRFVLLMDSHKMRVLILEKLSNRWLVWLVAFCVPIEEMPFSWWMMHMLSGCSRFVRESHALSKQPDQQRTERVSSQRIKERTESEFGFRNLIRQLTAMNDRCSICILGSEIVGTNLFESVVACLLFEISRFCSLWFVPNWSLIENHFRHLREKFGCWKPRDSRLLSDLMEECFRFDLIHLCINETNGRFFISVSNMSE